MIVTPANRPCYIRAMNRGWMAVAVTIVAQTASGGALAQSVTSVQARGSIGINYTDNALAAPADAIASEPQVDDDFFLTVTPGLVLYHETPTLQLLASYERPFAIYFSNSTANNAADVATANILYAASPVDALGINMRVSRATTRQISFVDPEATQVGTLPVGDNTLLTANLTQNLTHDFSPDWRMSEDVGATFVYPLDTAQAQPTRWVASANMAADYRFSDDALGVVVSHSLAFTDDVEGSQPSTNLGINGINGRWRRDLTPEFTMMLGAGATSAVNLSAGLFYVGPVWTGQLGYSIEEFSLILTYNRGIVPNVIAGPTSLTDTLQVVGGVPLGLESNVTLRGIVGGTYNQLLTLDSDDPSPTVFSWSSDVELAWAPPFLPRFSVRYQHMQQFEPTLPSSQIRPFVINNASFTVSYAFPDANIPRVRRGTAGRVDTSDSPPLAQRQPPEQAATPNTGAPPATAP